MIPAMLGIGVEEKVEGPEDYKLNQELFEFYPKEKKALISGKTKIFVFLF